MCVQNYIEQKLEYEELAASVTHGREDIAAGRVVSHEEAISRVWRILANEKNSSGN